MGLFVGGTLLAFAVTLAPTGPRRREVFLLCTFLLLVAVNFLADGVARMGIGSTGWRHVALVALALDPLYLLLFVSAYPFPQRTRWVTALLAAVTCSAAVSLGVVLLAPGLLVTRPFGAPFNLQIGSPFFFLLEGTLVVAYLASWMLAVRGARTAPTPSLQERAAWVVVAVGVMVVTRMGLLWSDLLLLPSRIWRNPPALTPIDSVLYSLPDLAAQAVLMAGAFALGLAAAGFLRRGGEPPAPTLRRALLRVPQCIAVLAAIHLLLVAWTPVGGPDWGWGASYALRWVVFAVVLGVGLLRFEGAGFHRAVDRVVPVTAGVVGGLAAGLLAAVAMGPALDTLPLAPALAVLVGAALAAPAGLGARSALQRLERSHALNTAPERRLELYRAALEAVWEDGRVTPRERAALERERRALGVGHDEARALEHMVASTQESGRRELQPGDEPVPGLVLERVIGEGGQGCVFAAREHTTGQMVAVKEHRLSGDEGAEARRGLLAELRALEGLAHPNVVRLRAVHPWARRILMVVDLVPGRNLAEVLAEGPPAEPEVRRVIAAVLAGLGAAHARGVVHRDLKPANILVGDDGTVRITDFGVALTPSGPEEVEATASGYEAVGRLTGTLAYMAPEQARGQPATPATDLYAAGLVAFEALTGRKALDVAGLSMLEALAVVEEPAFDWTSVPLAWRPWLEVALAPRPSERFASADAMRAAMPSVATGPETGHRSRGATVRRGGAGTPAGSARP